MSLQFTELNLHPHLVQSVSELGYTEATPIQEALIPLMMEGKDVIGQAQTGTGKTAAFALPMLHNLVPGGKEPQCLVLTPTRELALQVAEAVEAYGRVRRARVLAVYGGQGYGPQLDKLRDGVDIVVGTPGRLLDLIERKAISLRRVRTVVLDEADEMLSMGFIDDIEAILACTPAERQTALFSATLPAPIRRLADRYMRDPQSITMQTQAAASTVEQRCYLVNHHDKTAALTRLFEMEGVTSALVFVRTRIGTSELANALTTRGFPAEALSGELSQDARERTLDRFRRNQIKVLVATDVAARGLDVDDISHVFNFDLPDEPAVYVHRIGRTGRAGKSGIAIALVTPREKGRLYEIERFTRQQLQRREMPGVAEILAHREALLLEQVSTWLTRDRCKKERALVDALVAQGHDIADIAAAALKVARADEKQKPIEALSEVFAQPRTDRRPPAFRPDIRKGKFHSDSRFDSRSDARPRAAAPSRDNKGMKRLSIDMGRSQGLRPEEVVGTIARSADIAGNTIGKITIGDHQTYVDVHESVVQRVLAKNGDYRIRKIALSVTSA